jgi:hypothetical protein
VAHWITFKEEQRLDWQKKDLAQLGEADQEIRETYELITDFPTMLRERQGERLDAWHKTGRGTRTSRTHTLCGGD